LGSRLRRGERRGKKKKGGTHPSGQRRRGVTFQRRRAGDYFIENPDTVWEKGNLD